jgi:hypothetical protein
VLEFGSENFMTKKATSQAQRDLSASLGAVELFFVRFGVLVRSSLADKREAQGEIRKNVKRTRKTIEQGATAPGEPFRL